MSNRPRERVFTRPVVAFGLLCGLMAACGRESERGDASIRGGSPGADSSGIEAGTGSRSNRATGAPGEVVAEYAEQGFVLRIVSRCGTTVERCPFSAEVRGPTDAAHQIAGVDYTYTPARRTSPGPITDAASAFRFEGEQHAGELVWADVRLASPPAGAATPVLLKGEVPFAAIVEPALPEGLRIQDRYYEEFLEGGVRIGQYFMKLVFMGEPMPGLLIQSVEYRPPADQPRPAMPLVRTEAYDNFAYEAGVSSSAQGQDVVVVIRWRDGKETTHRMKIRLPE